MSGSVFGQQPFGRTLCRGVLHASSPFFPEILAFRWWSGFDIRDVPGRKFV
jgi:hypothetical protein